jgi:hypothetical protein
MIHPPEIGLDRMVSKLFCQGFFVLKKNFRTAFYTEGYEAPWAGNHRMGGRLWAFTWSVP